MDVGPRWSVDSSISAQTSGVIGDRDEASDEFAPVDVKVAEPARESVIAPVPKVARESGAVLGGPELEAFTPATGNGRKALWIGLALVVAAAVVVFALREQIFGGASEEPSSDAAAPADTQQAEVGTPPDEPATAPDPKLKPKQAATSDASPDTPDLPDDGKPELTPEQREEVETKYESARRYFQNFRRTDKASALIDEVLAIDPDHAPTLVLRAELLMDDERFAEALVVVRQASRADPELGAAYYTLGGLLETTDDLAGAVEAYRRFLELEPDSEYAEAIRGQISRLERKLARAKSAQD